MLAGQIVNGLVSGAMYALVAIGFTLIIGVLDKLNFNHPEVFMFGGYVGLVALPHMPVAGAFAMAFAVGGLLGVLTEWMAFRRFVGSDARTTAALSSLALGLILTDLVHKVWGTEPLRLPNLTGWLSESFGLLGVNFLNLQMVLLAITFALMWALHHVIAHTRMGRQIRAVAESSAHASLLGVHVLRVNQVVFFISSGLASIAGLMLALRADTVSPDLGLTFGLKALAVMAIGGMGDMRGAVLAGLGIGVLEALMFHFGLGRLGELTVWAAMIATLLLKPAGLFASGHHGQEQRV